MASEWVTLVKITLDTETLYISPEGVPAPANYYEDLLLSIGPISREVSLVPKTVSFSGCTISLDNTKLRFSKLKDKTAFRNRKVEVLFGNLRDGFSSLVPVFTGIISRWSISENRCRLQVRDAIWEKFRTRLPGLIDSSIFTNLPAGTAVTLIPIIFGNLTSIGGTADGLAKLTFIELSGGQYRYLVARHACNEITTVYKDGVSIGGWTAATQSYGGYTCQIIHFAADQRPGVITADVKGYDNTSLLEAPAREIKAFLEQFSGVASGDFDITLFDAAAAKQDDRGILGTIWLGDENKTVADYLDLFSEGLNLSIFSTTAGKIGVYQATFADYASATLAATFDENDIASIEIDSNEHVASRQRGQYRYDWINKTWERAIDENDEVEEDSLGQEVIDSFLCYPVRHDETAGYVRHDRKFLMRENAQIATVDVPPKHYTLDLNNWVKLTHWQGPAQDGLGWRDKLGRVIRVEIDPMPTNPKIHAIVAVPAEPRPSDHSGRRLWVAGDLITGKSDGDTISPWSCQIRANVTAISGSHVNSDLSNATAGERPLYKTGIVNGKPVVRFDGSDDSLSAGEAMLTTSIGYFGFIVVFNLPSVSVLQTIFDKNAGAIELWVDATGVLRFTSNGNTNQMDHPISANTWYIVSIWCKVGGITTMHVNGTLASSGGYTASPTMGAVAEKIGGRTGRFANVDIAEFCIFGGATGSQKGNLADYDRKGLEKYLANKYAISIT